MKTSKELYTFFKEWLEWAEDGGKEHGVFSAYAGLCSNLDWWSGDRSMGSELYEVLDFVCGDGFYPFGEDDYSERANDATQHECPRRLAFVREQIKKYEEE